MFVTIPKPAVGDPVKKSMADALVDNLADLNDRLKAAESDGSILKNGSFEEDVDGIPDGWTRTLFNGGSMSILATDSGHGGRSIRFVSPGGAGNGGGYVESGFIRCSSLIPILLLWQHKASVADVRNKVELVWYSVDGAGTKTLISTATLYDNSTTNPTSWQMAQAAAAPPATARYFKIKLTGCDSSDATAGSAYFDDVSIRPAVFINKTVLDSEGATKWKCPPGVTFVLVQAFGGGAGGSKNSGAGGGGGAGGASESYLSVVPGTEYDVEVGSAGSGTTTNNSLGTTGTYSTFGPFLVTANGGSPNGVGAGVGIGQVRMPGENAVGANGGFAPWGGVPGLGLGRNANGYAAGGGGLQNDTSPFQPSGNGGRGAVIIHHN